jgi:hypothetical protein
LFTTNCLVAQEFSKTEVYATLGKPTFHNISPNSNNLIVNIGANRNLGRFFSIGIESEYGRMNNFISNLKEGNNADERLFNSTASRLILTGFDKVDVLSINGKFYIHAINNKRFRLSANSYFGYLQSWGSSFRVSEVSFSGINQQVTDYKTITYINDYGNLTYGIGLTFDVKFSHYYAGILLNSRFTYTASDFGDVLTLDEVAVFPNYYSAGLRFGYRFD